MWHRYKPIWYEGISSIFYYLYSIPTSVFHQIIPSLCTDVDTLHALNWSSQLDQVFTENLKRDHNIHWQYFASKEGLLRFFPAHK